LPGLDYFQNFSNFVTRKPIRIFNAKFRSKPYLHGILRAGWPSFENKEEFVAIPFKNFWHTPGTFWPIIRVRVKPFVVDKILSNGAARQVAQALNDEATCR